MRSNAQLHRLGTVLSYCDKNSRELQTVNLMAQRNVPVTFVPQAAPAAPNASSAGSNDGVGCRCQVKTGAGRVDDAKPVQRRFVAEELEITGKENATNGSTAS